MLLDEFNAAPRDAAAASLLTCAAVGSWAATLADERPFPDRQALLRRARELAADWTGDQLDEALADHPRIGERHAAHGTTSASAAASTREQAGVGEDAEVRARLADGNARYEQRFGRIYLVRAAGRSAEDMLALLEQRLGNDPATEVQVAAAQLAEIALLRLEHLIDPATTSEVRA